MKPYSLNKSEKLKSRKSIDSVFRTGKSIFSPPFRVLYHFTEKGNSPALMTVAVPKKMIRQAVDRNLLKRRCREAYRMKKPELYAALEQKNLHIELVFLYQTNDILEYKQIQSAVNFLMIRLLKDIEKQSK